MSPQTLARDARRALMLELRPERRRGWLTHGVAALAVSALGLIAAGALTVTSSAETVGSVATQTRVISSPSLGSSTTLQSRTTMPSSGTATQVTAASVLAEGSLSSFARRDVAAGRSTRSTLREAQVKEKAAARAEDLTKASASISRAVRDAGTAERSKDLESTQQATQDNAVRIAEEARKRAEAARVAAEVERKAAEAAEAAAAAAAVSAVDAPTADPTTTTDTGSTTTAPPVDTSTPVTTGGGSASPVPNAVIGAHFGQYGLWSRYHTGLDFRAGMGVPIKAVKSGVVLFAGNSGDWSGNHVAVEHADGMTTMSSHMSSMAVSAGQTVQAGQVIGYVGQTGRAFGAHLHFELYPTGVKYGDVYKAVDPQPWLRANGIQTR